MINNRKGVSAVVANVLIILLVVVGVALIWAAVRPAIEEGAEGIQADCIITSVEVQSCTLDGTVVTVKRNAGGPSSDVTEVRLVKTDSSGDSVTSHVGITLGALETEDINVPTIKSGDSYNVAAVVDGTVCEVLSQPTTCTA